MTTHSNTHLFLPSIDEKKIINQHIDYVNHCSNYLSGIVLILENYNAYVNKTVYYYVRANYDIDKIKAIKDFHTPIVIMDVKNKQRKTYQYTIEDLEQEYTQLTINREKNTSEITQLLKKSIEDYQNKFNELGVTFEELTRLSNDKEVFFKSSSKLFKSSYYVLDAYEKKQEELVIINDQFHQITQQLFGKEKLPQALQRNKVIAFSVKGFVLSIRNNDKEQLQKFINTYHKNNSIQNTDQDYKEVGSFGNYLKYHKVQIPKILVRSEWIYKLGVSYLNDKTPFLNSYNKKTYDYKVSLRAITSFLAL